MLDVHINGHYRLFTIDQRHLDIILIILLSNDYKVFQYLDWKHSIKSRWVTLFFKYNFFIKLCNFNAKFTYIFKTYMLQGKGENLYIVPMKRERCLGSSRPHKRVSLPDFLPQSCQIATGHIADSPHVYDFSMIHH